jgi:hypothetical protein
MLARLTQQSGEEPYSLENIKKAHQKNRGVGQMVK